MAPPSHWCELASPALESIYNPALVQTAFETEEFALDTPSLCRALGAVLQQAPRLALRMNTWIDRVSPEGARYQVWGQHEGVAVQSAYDMVVNCLWEQRLGVDATLGLEAGRPVVHRYKVGLRNRDPRVCSGLPTTTFLIGPYGDTATYPGLAYVSWYPTGLLAQEISLRPAHFAMDLDESRRQQIIEASLLHLRALIPGAESLLQPNVGNWEVVGAYITAWGRSGIDDRHSQLHERYDVGVFSDRNYHSVDTGKLTLAPMFATEVCRRILLNDHI